MSLPLQRTDRVVVIGAGHAGVQLADSLRAEGFTGSITLLGDEEALPYQRPPVSKEHLTVQGEPMSLRGEQFYQDSAIELSRGDRAVALDRDQRTVRTAAGELHRYDHLVFATGSRPRELDLPGWSAVHRLHTPADAAGVRAGLEQAESLVVIGAGFIGLELASAAAARGVKTTVLAADDRALARSLSPQASAHATAAHESTGVAFRFGCAISGLISEDGGIAGVRLPDGDQLRADLVVAGVGAVANDELAATSGLAVKGGILADATLATSDRRVSAIGDCVRFHSNRTAGLLRLESVQNAHDHARHLARRLVTGEDAPYLDVPWFWSVQGSMKLTIAGLPSPTLSVLRREDGGTGGGCEKFSLFGFEQDRLVCVESFNRPADHLAARRMLGSGRLPAREQVSDPDFDLVAFSR